MNHQNPQNQMNQNLINHNNNPNYDHNYDSGFNKPITNDTHQHQEKSIKQMKAPQAFFSNH
jgi:hypothetical protein